MAKLKWHLVSHFYGRSASPASALMSRVTGGAIDVLFVPAQRAGPGQVVRWPFMEMPAVKPSKTMDPDMTVDEIMRRWPATIRVFIRNRMLCIGCPIGVFHTVRDACHAHDLDEETVSRQLLAAMTSDATASGPSAFEPAAATSGGGSPPPA